MILFCIVLTEIFNLFDFSLGCGRKCTRFRVSPDLLFFFVPKVTFDPDVWKTLYTYLFCEQIS